MKTNKFKSICKIVFSILLAMVLLLALYLNKNKPLELFNREGSTFEKAVVTEIIKDNLQDDNTRMGKQIVKVKVLSIDVDKLQVKLSIKKIKNNSKPKKKIEEKGRGFEPLQENLVGWINETLKKIEKK